MRVEELGIVSSEEYEVSLYFIELMKERLNSF